MSTITIDDIVPATVTRAGGQHAKTSEGAPCPHSLAKAMEDGALYFTAGGQTPVAVSAAVLLKAVHAVVPGDGAATKFDAIPNVLDGMPPPKKGKSNPVDSLHSLRVRELRLDAHTTDMFVRNLALEPRRRMPSNAAAKSRLLAHPSLRTCQSMFHDTNVAANNVSPLRRAVMCNPCWENYRFKRAGKGRHYYRGNNVRKSARLFASLRPLFSATAEAFCGYIAVCSAQTSEFRATKSLPVPVLEEVGLAAALYLWAMPYALGSYSALRLLHTTRPERATALQTRVKLRRPPNELMWWKRAEEHGFSTRPLTQLRRSGWAAPLYVATKEHAIAWSKDTAFSVAALGMVAAVAGYHPRLQCVIKVRVGARPSRPVRRLPEIKMTRAGVATVHLKTAENITWAYAWRCLCKAEDVADSIGIKGTVQIILELEGNPLAVPVTSTPHPAWDAIKCTPYAVLLPCATGHFFKWALSQATERDEMASLTTADMYPATAEQVAVLKEHVKKGFPPAEDVPMRDAAKIVFGDTSHDTDELDSVQLLGGDAL